MTIPTYIINLKSRADRRKNVLEEFNNKPEFNVTIVEAIKHKVGSIGLWETIRHILKNLVPEKEEYILICEDDHEFTGHYSKEMLFESIASAQAYEADILSGGVSWVTNIIQVGQNMFWVERFSGLQFTIMFRKFFEKCLEAEFNAFDEADYKISELSCYKFFIAPFISIQKDFGYSDVTPENNIEGRVSESFKLSSETVNVAQKLARHYENTLNEDHDLHSETFNDVSIPTYIINLPERTDRRVHVEEQFKDKKEFNITIVEACKHEIEHVGLWLSIRKVVQMAMQNDDDVIIIGEDDHEFTKDYTKEYLLKNIIAAHEQGFDMLLGGVSDMKTALPISKNRYWISSFRCTKFIVLYKNMFRLIIDEPYDQTITADGKLSELAVNKAVLFPFVSVQREFGYSDLSPEFDSFKMNKPIDKKFQECIDRFQRIKDIYLKYQL